MKTANWRKTIKEHVLILLIFTILTLILTYPVITEINSYTAGVGGDAFVFKWSIWHVNETLKGGGGIADLYHTDLLFYPYGADLAFHTFSLTNTLFLASPLFFLTDNIVLIYNLLFLFNFIVAGYAMYLLIRYLVKNRMIAFLVGFAYAFSPLHMAWGMGFLNLMSFLWTPLFFLFFFKLFEEKKIINAVIAAIFLFFLALASWYHLVFAFLIATFYFVYKIFTVPALFNKHFFLRVTTLLFFFGIIITPFVLPMFSTYFKGDYDWPHPMFTGITLLHYFLPNPFQSVWGEGVISMGGELFGEWGPVVKTVTPGYLVIFISLLYLIKARKHLFWVSLVVLFSLISVNFQGLAVPLVGYIPFVNVIAQLNFFSFGVLFSILLFFAFALNYFLPKWKEVLIKSCFFSAKYAQYALFILIFAILTCEYLVAPNYPTTSSDWHNKVKIEAAEEIGQVVKGPHPELDDDFSVLAFPIRINFEGGQTNHYFQIFHGKPIIGGEASRPEVANLVRSEKIKKIFHNNESNEVRQFLKEYKVGYIIVFAPEVGMVYLNPEERKKTEKDVSFSESLLLKIPGEFISLTRPEFYIYEVWSEK